MGIINIRSQSSSSHTMNLEKQIILEYIQMKIKYDNVTEGVIKQQMKLLPYVDSVLCECSESRCRHLFRDYYNYIQENINNEEHEFIKEIKFQFYFFQSRLEEHSMIEDILVAGKLKYIFNVYIIAKHKKETKELEDILNELILKLNDHFEKKYPYASSNFNINFKTTFTKLKTQLIAAYNLKYNSLPEEEKLKNNYQIIEITPKDIITDYFLNVNVLCAIRRNRIDALKYDVYKLLLKVEIFAIHTTYLQIDLENRKRSLSLPLEIVTDKSEESFPKRTISDYGKGIKIGKNQKKKQKKKELETNV